jgi:hypothetical protein
MTNVDVVIAIDDTVTSRNIIATYFYSLILEDKSRCNDRRIIADGIDIKKKEAARFSILNKWIYMFVR